MVPLQLFKMYCLYQYHKSTFLSAFYGALCILDSVLMKVLKCCCGLLLVLLTSMWDGDPATKDPANQASWVFQGLVFLILIIAPEPQKCYKIFCLCSGFCSLLFATFVACKFLHFGQNKTVFMTLLANVLKAYVAGLFIVQHLNNFIYWTYAEAEFTNGISVSVTFEVFQRTYSWCPVVTM